MRLATLALFSVLIFLAACTQQKEPAHKVYDESADAKAEIAQAASQARADHKRILLVFGGNWCGDCLALDRRFHEAPAQPVVESNFHVVHVDIGHADKNLDLADKYGIPLKKGVPAIAVLDSDGKLLYSQKNGEFEAARRMSPQEILEFLNAWKPDSTARK
jgi:thioredoxin 1